MKIDNIDLISDMYTKISDIKFKGDIENNIKINNKINNIESNNKNYNSSLDILLYEEDKPKKQIIKNIKPKKI